MGIRSVLSAILVNLSVLMVLTPAHAAPKKAAIILDVDTGLVLFESAADKPRYPASLTKMMTLYMIFDKLKAEEWTLDTKLWTSPRAAGQTPSKLNLRKGQSITVEQAIYALVVKSANDVATVVAEAIAGTEWTFGKMMTKRAHQLGMTDSKFVNASGLPHRAQKTTARDMAKLGLALMSDHLEYFSYFAAEKFTWRGRTYKSHNKLLAKYDGTNGIKTGYIRASGFNLVSSVKRDGVHLLGVYFGGRTSYERDRRLMQLLDESFKKVQPEIFLAKDSGQAIDAPDTVRQAALDPIDIDIRNKPNVPLGAAAGSSAYSGWAIHVGTFKRAGPAGRTAEAATKVAPAFLKNSQIAIMEADVGSATRYQARLVGISKTQADKACAHLKPRKFVCSVIRL